MNLRRLPSVLVVVASAWSLPVRAREPFPVPFVVEHHAVDGSVGAPVAGETVRDTYGGSLLVSERSDGSRTIVDLARREVTEVRPKEGTYWSLSFGRFAELRRRLGEAESTGEASKRRAQAVSGRLPIRVEEVTEVPAPVSRGALSAATAPGKRLRASVEGGPSLDVWLDESGPRLSPEAIAAIADFERTVLGTTDDAVGPADLLEAVRKMEGGALAVRTRRIVNRTPGSRDDGPVLETVVTKAAPVVSLSPDLVKVPEGLRRIPSPLELVVSWAEDEAALRQRGRR